ncbi:DUF2218 domain-containing protein [Sedimentitalea sp.]|uniref:DUF2218 domain-containing protein n=1 Tax=Sedimentitalea sp. TaxID=2048915 RepID=UPI003298B8A0
MPTSTATIETTRATIYLQQLCKHFGHKLPVEFTHEAGRIEFPFGQCLLEAGDDALTLRVEGGEIARLEKVMGDHLARFAFRENPDITWRQHT